MTTSNPACQVKTLDVTTMGFCATFTRDIGYLKAGAPIGLGLPLNKDSMHGAGHTKPTTVLCAEVIRKKYTDEQLSIMLMARTTDIDGYEIKAAKTMLQAVDNGKIITYPAWFTIIKLGDWYIAAELDYDHEKETGNKAYVHDSEIQAARNNSELKAIFNAA